ncbi:MAG TPA: hypothetical protein VGJ05_16220 [Fimbriiglobus sp.]
MRLNAETIAKWQSWGTKIENDLMDHLIHPRKIYRDFIEMAIANTVHIDKHRGGEFCGFVIDGYVAQVAMGIRKHAKNDDSISFRVLLDEVKKCAKQFTYEYYLSLVPAQVREPYVTEKTFALFSVDGKTVSESKVQDDIDRLDEVTAKVVTLCDKYLAHLDRKGYQGKVTFDDLDECADVFNELVCKYMKLIKNSGLISLDASIGWDWKAIFRVPLDIRPVEKPKPQWLE